MKHNVPLSDGEMMDELAEAREAMTETCFGGIRIFHRVKDSESIRRLIEHAEAYREMLRYPEAAMYGGMIAAATKREANKRDSCEENRKKALRDKWTWHCWCGQHNEP